MDLNELNDKVKMLQEVRLHKNDTFEKYKEFSEIEQNIKNQLKDALVESGSQSLKSNLGTVYLATRKTVIIADEEKLVKNLQKDKVMAKEYLALRPNELFLNAIKSKAQFDLEGLEVKETQSLGFRGEKNNE